VKLLVDENLAHRFVGMLEDLYPGSAHVHQCGLGSADDAAIWNYAKKSGFTIVSKDSDFEERSILQGCPPKVVWLRVSNCTSAEIENLLRTAHIAVKQFIEKGDETCLVLGYRHKPELYPPSNHARDVLLFAHVSINEIIDYP
jgi:predicted nuclease of predicted toxin-antitoxin system